MHTGSEGGHSGAALSRADTWHWSQGWKEAALGLGAAEVPGQVGAGEAGTGTGTVKRAWFAHRAQACHAGGRHVPAGTVPGLCPPQPSHSNLVFIATATSGKSPLNYLKGSFSQCLLKSPNLIFQKQQESRILKSHVS